MPVGVSAITPLANLTLGSGQTTITFSSISGAYRDLLLVINYGTGSTGTPRIRINGDTLSTYSWQTGEGNGSSATAASSSGTSAPISQTNNLGTNNNTNTANAVLHFMDYSVTDKQKIVLVRGNLASTAVTMATIRWANTSAITSFTLTPFNDSFLSGSTFALYGVSSV